MDKKTLTFERFKQPHFTDYPVSKARTQRILLKFASQSLCASHFK